MAKRSGRPKPKSIKSKAINKNSKRKLDTLGKKLEAEEGVCWRSDSLHDSFAGIA